MKNLVVLLLLTILFINCEKEKISPNPKNNKPTNGQSGRFIQSFPITYNAQLIDGKLPYPHHDPMWTQQQYKREIDKLFIVNNYGLYQSGKTPNSTYFHDGLDFVLPNGTPIFAVEDGIIRSNIGSNEFYRTLVVEDVDGPKEGWSYTHIYFFEVRIGDTVRQGQFLGRVNFAGVEHMHLNRLSLREKGSWFDYSDLINEYPNDFFVLNDTIPPDIKLPINFFKNKSNHPFEDGSLDTVSNQVDIVVSIRDRSSYSYGFAVRTKFGDRLAMKSIHYRILKEGKEIKSFNSFDFGKLKFYYHQNIWKEALTVFKHRTAMEKEPLNFDGYYTHYTITNSKERPNGTIDPTDSKLSWNTLEKDALDKFIYPNGLYEIEVTAFDGAGNKTTILDNVFVKN